MTVRVQVIDLQSFTLDLTLPTYLPARDLSQRIARDAGLTAYDDQAKRRRYWMRARGRLVQEHETLADLGVVNQNWSTFCLSLHREPKSLSKPPIIRLTEDIRPKEWGRLSALFWD